MAARMIHSADVREITATAALSSGDILLSADGKAVVITDLSGVANTQKTVGQCSGVYEVAAVSGDTYSAGARVYLTEATQVAATSSGAGKILIGVAAYAKTDGQTVVKVDLNGTATSVDDWS